MPGEHLAHLGRTHRQHGLVLLRAGQIADPAAGGHVRRQHRRAGVDHLASQGRVNHADGCLSDVIGQGGFLFDAQRRAGKGRHAAGQLGAVLVQQLQAQPRGQRQPPPHGRRRDPVLRQRQRIGHAAAVAVHTAIGIAAAQRVHVHCRAPHQRPQGCQHSQHQQHQRQNPAQAHTAAAAVIRPGLRRRPRVVGQRAERQHISPPRGLIPRRRAAGRGCLAGLLAGLVPQLPGQAREQPGVLVLFSQRDPPLPHTTGGSDTVRPAARWGRPACGCPSLESGRYPPGGAFPPPRKARCR